MESHSKSHSDHDPLDDINLELLDEVGKPRNSDSSELDHDDDKVEARQAEKPKRGATFWTVIGSLMVTLMLSGLEANITATALPTIVKELGTSNQFVWILNAYTLASTIIQPPLGQLADVFGRKIPIILSVLAFTLGSLVSGLSTNMTIMITGRALQGAGSGGTFVMTDLIVSDLIPLKERPQFMGLLMTGSSIAYAAGPSIGGFLTQYLSWRWAYLLNVPIGAITCVLLWISLRLKHQKPQKLSEAVAKIDFLGTGTLSVSTIAMMTALASDDGFWKTTPMLLSFVFGCAGMIIFGFLQNSRFCPFPIMPLRLFNLPSSLAFLMAFLSNAIMMMVPYFLPIYFQGVLQVTPSTAGIYLLATVLALLPAAIAIGGIVTKTGRYRMAHIVSFALMGISMAGYMLTNQNTKTLQWISLSIIGAIGIGGLMPTTLPAAQAPLPDTDVAAVTATFAFFRSLGFLWGFAIPSFVFKTEVATLTPSIDNADIASLMGRGGAFANARADFMASLAEPVKTQVLELFIRSLRAVWRTGFAASLLGLVFAVTQPEVIMRDTLKTEFGLDVGDGSEGDQEAAKGQEIEQEYSDSI